MNEILEKLKELSDLLDKVSSEYKGNSLSAVADRRKYIIIKSMISDLINIIKL